MPRRGSSTAQNRLRSPTESSRVHIAVFFLPSPPNLTTATPHSPGRLKPIVTPVSFRSRDEAILAAGVAHPGDPHRPDNPLQSAGAGPGWTRELTLQCLLLPGQSPHLSAAGFSGESLLGSEQLHPKSFQSPHQTLSPRWAPPSWSVAELLPRGFEGSGTSVLGRFRSPLQVAFRACPRHPPLLGRFRAWYISGRGLGCLD